MLFGLGKKKIKTSSSKGQNGKKAVGTKKDVAKARKGSLPSSNTNSGESSPKVKASTQSREVSKALYEKRLKSLIKSKTDLPDYEKVLSEDSDLVSLSDKMRENYLLLIANSETKKIILIISDTLIKKPLSNEKERIVSSVQKGGWQVAEELYMTHTLLGDMWVTSGIVIETDDTGVFGDHFDRVIKYACDNNISDVHIEVGQFESLIRMRRNSLLENYENMGSEYAMKFCSVVYQVLSTKDSKDMSFLPKSQQSSVISTTVSGHGSIRVRLNTIPTAHGFDMVLRILKTGVDKKLTLKELGYNEHLIKSLEIASAKPVGGLIVAGTTGSGKSTTLKTMLERKVDEFMTPNGLTIKIITVEDPPEYNIAHASQVNVSTSRAGDDETAKNPFSSAIKAAMRCDPDILMAGEIRDEDSAELFMHITLSGHQVFSTIHASSALSIVARLRSNGIPNEALGNNDFLSALVYQKLVPMVCSDCYIPYEKFFNDEENARHYEPLRVRIDQVMSNEKRSGIRFRDINGCPKCKSGVKGQTVVAEVVIPDPKMLEFFMRGEDNYAWSHHKKMGGQTIIDHALEKVSKGICDPRDIEAKVDVLTVDLVMDDAEFNYDEMEKYGLENQQKTFSYCYFDEINDVRKAKVVRAMKLIDTKRTNGEHDLDGLTKDVLATIIECDEYDPLKLYEKFKENGIHVDLDGLGYMIDDIKKILK